MKKSKSAHRTKKPRKAKGVSYNRGGPVDTLARKKAFDFDVKKMVRASHQFRGKVSTLLDQYYANITTLGAASLGPDAPHIVETLDLIRTDLESYEAELTPVLKETEEFLALTEGDEFSWLASTVDITSRLENLLNQYAELYILNHQTLLTYEH